MQTATTSETKTSGLIAEAAKAADAIVSKNITRLGFVASIDQYPEVWARDSVITSLGATLGHAKEATAALGTSLKSLGSAMDRFGQVPYLVHLDTGRAEYGSADSNPWFVLGACHYAKMSNDTAWMQSMADTIVRALDWCEAMDLRKRGLMSSGECADWADLLANRGHVLFPNVLYARALSGAAEMLKAARPDDAARFQARHDRVLEAIRSDFWVTEPREVKDNSHQQTRIRIGVTLRRRHYFLPYIDGFAFGERFDTTANLLAIVTGVATKEQSTRILDYIDAVQVNRPFPVRVLYPPIQPGDPDWREYYKVWDLNMPNQYHNGGIWPWVGGLYVATLAVSGRRDQAAAELEMLARAIQQGHTKWECNEWLHGVSGKPMGSAFQAWSAGMFLYAKHAVETGTAPALGANE